MGRFYPVPSEGGSVARYAADAQSIRTITLSLSTARSMERLPIGGTVLWVFSASSLSANLDVRFGDQTSEPLTLKRGVYIRGLAFSELWLTNAAQSGQTITLVYADEKFGAIQIENASADYAEVTPTKATKLFTLPDVTIVGGASGVLLEANAARRVASISALDTNAGAVRIGTSATATRGAVLYPGLTIDLETTAAITANNPTGVDAKFGLLWTED